MRILTYVRQVLDAEESVHIANNAVALENSKLVMDTMDEYGVEEALRLRESGTEAEIVAVAIGPARVQEPCAPPSPWASIAPSTSKPTSVSTPSLSAKSSHRSRPRKRQPSSSPAASKPTGTATPSAPPLPNASIGRKPHGPAPSNSKAPPSPANTTSTKAAKPSPSNSRRHHHPAGTQRAALSHPSQHHEVEEKRVAQRIARPVQRNSQRSNSSAPRSRSKIASTKSSMAKTLPRPRRNSSVCSATKQR